jgi:glycosyltransferase involved in cell wall biosynthesis
LREQLQSHVEELGLSSRVQFLGIRQDVADLMCASDVFVSSSVWESFGLVVAEAMACERVVVATDSGGVREVLGDAGYLVPSRDPQALATALAKAASLPQADAAELGTAARRRIVDTYSFERSIAKWRELYASLVATAQATR